MPATLSEVKAPSRPAPPTSERSHIVWLIVAVAFLLRFVYVLIARTYQFHSPDHFDFAQEIGCIARSLATGRGFSSPFPELSGPTTWVAPLYPALMALLFKIFGVYSTASALVVYAFNCAASAATCWPLFSIAVTITNRRVALISAWIWALAPPFMYWSVNWLWDAPLTTFVLTTLIWQTLRLSREVTIRQWISFGAVWGLSALLNPSLLSIFPVCLIYIAWHAHRRRALALLPSVVCCVTMLLVISPWILRNYRTFGKPVFIRGNFWLEMRVGNSLYADGRWMGFAHPEINPIERRLYLTLGEQPYFELKKRETLSFIHENPGYFGELCFRRVLLYWWDSGDIDQYTPDVLLSVLRRAFSTLALIGVVFLWIRRCPARGLLTGVFVTFPLIYYLTYPYGRYRHVLEPLLLICVVYVTTQLKESKRFFPESERSTSQKPRRTVRLPAFIRRHQAFLVEHQIAIAIAIAFLIRFGWVLIGRTYEFEGQLGGADHFRFGYEYGTVARALVTGHGYSSPFPELSGPTSMIPPIYTYFMAAIFKVFGIYSLASAIVILGVSCFCSALTCAPIFGIAHHLGNRRIALASTWTWALTPMFMTWAVRWIWESVPSTLVLASLVLFTLRLGKTIRRRDWLFCGVFWGLAALLNPALLSALPFSLIYIAWHARKRSERWFLHSALCCVMFFATISPWIVRNYVTFHRFIFIRGNFWAEMSFGNSPYSNGTWMRFTHPEINLYERQRYLTMGEPAYFDFKKHAVLQFIHEYPWYFRELCFRRVLLYWWGFGDFDGTNLDLLETYWQRAFATLALVGMLFALWKRRPAAPLLAAIVLLNPIPYYLAFPNGRYRHVIEPFLLILAMYALSQVREFKGLFQTDFHEN